MSDRRTFLQACLAAGVGLAAVPQFGQGVGRTTVSTFYRTMVTPSWDLVWERAASMAGPWVAMGPPTPAGSAIIGYLEVMAPNPFTKEAPCYDAT